MPQNEYMERHRKLYGRRFDFTFRQKKKEARKWKKQAKLARILHGRRARLHTMKRFKEKIELKKKYP